MPRPAERRGPPRLGARAWGLPPRRPGCNLTAGFWEGFLGGVGGFLGGLFLASFVLGFWGVLGWFRGFDSHTRTRPAWFRGLGLRVFRRG